DEEMKNIFLGLLEHNNTRKTLLLLVDSGIYFYIALVYYFRIKNANKIDSFKADIESLLPYDKLELSLIFLGLYYGYSNLRADEEIKLDNNFFKKILKKDRINMKFKLDSKLDYITIETIYIYTFNKKQKGYEFEYLEYPSKPKEIKLAEDNKFKTWYSIERTSYYDIEQIRIRKRVFTEIVSKKLETYDAHIVFGKHHIFSYAAKYLKEIIKLPMYGEKFLLYCKKEDFLQAVKDIQSVIKQNELLDLFAVDKK
ncbi:MAG: hypothetical protein K8R44_01725, partial [Sulfurimonas sp.]|nr:hypothetical protein [Sulfurimonas sp.]